MNKQELNEMILNLVLDYGGAEYGTTKQATEIAQQIKSLCFQWVLEQIEDLDAYDGIDDRGEDDYGRYHSKNMGEAVLIENIHKILKEEK